MKKLLILALVTVLITSCTKEVSTPANCGNVTNKHYHLGWTLTVKYSSGNTSEILVSKTQFDSVNTGDTFCK